VTSWLGTGKTITFFHSVQAEKLPSLERIVASSWIKFTSSSSFSFTSIFRTSGGEAADGCTGALALAAAGATDGAGALALASAATAGGGLAAAFSWTGAAAAGAAAAGAVAATAVLSSFLVFGSFLTATLGASFSVGRRAFNRVKNKNFQKEIFVC
jgi:hypothetical protein